MAWLGPPVFLGGSHYRGRRSENWPRPRCWPDSVARRTGLAPRQRGWDTELPGYRSYFPDWLQRGFHSVTTTSALCRVPSASVPIAHGPVEATQTQQVTTMQSAVRGSRGRLRALRAQAEALNPTCPRQGGFFWKSDSNQRTPASHSTAGGNEATREEGRAFQVNTCVKA